MSYPIDLNEYTTEQLVAEIRRRNLATAEQRCPYCEKSLEPADYHTCRFKEELAQYHGAGTGQTIGIGK